MLERTHIGIESHKTQLWLDLQDLKKKKLDLMLLRNNAVKLNNKGKKQGQGANNRQDLKLTST